MTPTILLVDDEPALREMVGDMLRSDGYTVVTAANCREAMSVFEESVPDAVLLDVMLPDGDGFGLFRSLRAQRDVPVLFLSARDEDSARLEGLGLGADDYITKPFLLHELSLRLRAVLRRVYHLEEQSHLGNVTILWGKGIVVKNGKEITLTAKEWSLLKKLWDNRDNIVTTDALCAALWDGPLVGYENTLMVHVRRLREKIEVDPSCPRHLLTVRGLGYRLSDEARP